MPDNEEIIETEDENTEPEINVIPSGCGSFQIEKRPRLVFVETDTDELEGKAGIWPGCIAATYGYESLWQLGADGEWVEIETPGNVVI